MLTRPYSPTAESQLFAHTSTYKELFGQSRRKIRPLRKKIWSSSNFKFLKEFGLKKHYFCLCEWENFLDFSRIRENMRRETIFFEVQPLFGPFSSKSAKIRKIRFGRRFVRPLHFLFGLFDLCGRTIGQLATLNTYKTTC